MAARFAHVKLDFAGERDLKTIDVPYLDAYEDRVIPDSLFDKSSLPTANELEGEYDIIFYAGECDQFFGNDYRTARGNVHISCNPDPNGHLVISGNVTMHPCMQNSDIIPHGGNYSFVERARVQREGLHVMNRFGFSQGPFPGDATGFPGDTTQPTGVIKIEVTNLPNEMFLFYRNNGHDYQRMDKARNGEIRVFREKVGAGIMDQKLLHPWDDSVPTSIVSFRNNEEAEELNRLHYEKTCSWLHRHTILDEESAKHIGRFVSPAPVLFFEKGDIQIDINWKRAAPGCYAASSCIIARRRTNDSSSKTLITEEMKFKSRMDSVQVEINKLEQKKDMVWLAFECANILRKQSNDDNLAVTFSEENERATSCIYYMDKILFDEELSIYGLCMESIEYVSAYPPRNMLTFTRLT